MSLGISANLVFSPRMILRDMLGDFPALGKFITLPSPGRFSPEKLPFSAGATGK